MIYYDDLNTMKLSLKPGRNNVGVYDVYSMGKWQSQEFICHAFI